MQAHNQLGAIAEGYASHISTSSLLTAWPLRGAMFGVGYKRKLHHSIGLVSKQFVKMHLTDPELKEIYVSSKTEDIYDNKQSLWVQICLHWLPAVVTDMM